MKTFIKNISTDEMTEARIIETVDKKENNFWVAKETGLPIVTAGFMNDIKEQGYSLICDTTEDRLRIGQQLQALRKEKGYTMRDVEPRSGINYQNIGIAEKGEVVQSIDTIIRLAHAYGYQLTLTPIDE